MHSLFTERAVCLLYQTTLSANAGAAFDHCHESDSGPHMDALESPVNNLFQVAERFFVRS